MHATHIGINTAGWENKRARKRNEEGAGLGKRLLNTWDSRFLFPEQETSFIDLFSLSFQKLIMTFRFLQNKIDELLTTVTFVDQQKS
jgi:hypothetical protein